LVVGFGVQDQIIIPIRFHEKFSEFLDKKYISREIVNASKFLKYNFTKTILA